MTSHNVVSSPAELFVFCIRFSVSGLSDSQWHWISVGVSFEWLAVYVDCVLVEKVSWMYPYMGITTDGLLMVGGIMEGFETPFEVSFYLHGYVGCGNKSDRNCSKYIEKNYLHKTNSCIMYIFVSRTDFM